MTAAAPDPVSAAAPDPVSLHRAVDIATHPASTVSPNGLPSCPAVELLRSAKWQERVEAMGSVLAAVQALGDPGPRCYELVQCVAFLPGWADKNFQVRAVEQVCGGGGEG